MDLLLELVFVKIHNIARFVEVYTLFGRII